MKTFRKDKLAPFGFVFLLGLILTLLYWGCSTDQSPMPSKAHPEGWVGRSGEYFHGTVVAESGTKSCKSCHGSDFQGGDSKVSCYTCHRSFPHPQEWMVISSDMFHGAFLNDNNYTLTGCQNCHGEDFQGGASGVSCYRCHDNYPHPDNWLTQSTEQFHGNDIRQANWSMESCKGCHGTDYRGGSSEVSCYRCHTAEAGPEACNVCHGNPEHANPPEDLNNNTATTALGVGAHEVHLEQFECTLCHIVPESFDDLTHIDMPPAEVKEQWTWDREEATCATSCHGPALVWNDFGN